MELKDYTTEELRAEISRRYAAKKSEREARLVCKNCTHYGEIDYYGKPITESTKWMKYTQCRFNKCKNSRYYKTNKPSQLACEHFERKG